LNIPFRPRCWRSNGSENDGRDPGNMLVGHLSLFLRSGFSALFVRRATPLGVINFRVLPALLVAAIGTYGLQRGVAQVALMSMQMIVLGRVLARGDVWSRMRPASI
jgi:hypothetical protein